MGTTSAELEATKGRALQLEAGIEDLRLQMVDLRLKVDSTTTLMKLFEDLHLVEGNSLARLSAPDQGKVRDLRHM